jgi:hypothetical protein
MSVTSLHNTCMYMYTFAYMYIYVQPWFLLNYQQPNTELLTSRNVVFLSESLYVQVYISLTVFSVDSITHVVGNT